MPDIKLSIMISPHCKRTCLTHDLKLFYIVEPFQSSPPGRRNKKQRGKSARQHFGGDLTQIFRSQYETSSNKTLCLAEAARAVSFPAGRKQAKIQLPACFLSIKASEVENLIDAIGAATSAGATGVLLISDNDTGLLLS